MITFRYMFIRKFYSDLYDILMNDWELESTQLIHIKGNAGIGKSWFQLYVIRRLLRDKDHSSHSYEFVIRQVEKIFYIIDLSTGEVRKIIFNPDEEKATMSMLDPKKVLYFFEPGEDQNIRPLAPSLPTLWTLSPNDIRIKEVLKQASGSDRGTTYYFPCLSYEETLAIVSKVCPSVKDGLETRFERVGGIIRALLFSGNRYREYCNTQEKRINEVKDVTIFQKKSLTIDTDTKGSNISTYLMHYIPSGNYEELDLEFASQYVELEIRRQLSLLDKTELYLAVLRTIEDDNSIDRSGMFLQHCFVSLLSEPSYQKGMKWQYAAIEQENNPIKWTPIKWEGRDGKQIKRTYKPDNKLFDDNFGKKDLIIYPSIANFPLADVVLSKQEKIKGE